MDAQTAESELRTPLAGWFGWLERERASGRFYRWAMIGTASLLAAILIGSFSVLRRSSQPNHPARGVRSSDSAVCASIKQPH